MKCTVCGKEMDPGGILISGRYMSAPEWIPSSEYEKRGLKTWRRRKGIPPCCEEALLETKIPSAFYCSSCGLVVTVMKTYEEN